MKPRYRLYAKHNDQFVMVSSSSNFEAIRKARKQWKAKGEVCVYDVVSKRDVIFYEKENK